MSLSLTKILSNPDSVLIGHGQNAQVLTRTEAIETAAEKSQALNPNLKKSPHQLSQAEEAVLAELKARDAEVRQHEQRHIAAAGSLAKGAPTYEYQIGPDGKPYAIGGQVKIDTSPVSGDPEASRAKARQIMNAALAPGDPSGQDQTVAMQAGLISQHVRQDAGQHSNQIEAENAYAENKMGSDSNPLANQNDYSLKLFA